MLRGTPWYSSESSARSALLLAICGIYAVVAYGVVQRTHEIGIRMALGARRAAVLGLVMRQSTILTAVGPGARCRRRGDDDEVSRTASVRAHATRYRDVHRDAGALRGHCGWSRRICRRGARRGSIHRPCCAATSSSRCRGESSGQLSMELTEIRGEADHAKTQRRGDGCAQVRDVANVAALNGGPRYARCDRAQREAHKHSEC